jgi:hypothetical protein
MNTNIMKKQPNIMIDIVGEPRERITIVENVGAWTNNARTILLAGTMRKSPKSIRLSKI